jgi:hypothetical protein
VLAPRTLVVGDDAELLVQLCDYLARAGVQARATRVLAEAWRRESAEAVVLFPDDFDAGDVTDGLSCVLSRAASPLVIVITAGPRLFEPLIESLGGAESVVILPKPIWGWVILDLLRSWTGAPD